MIKELDECADACLGAQRAALQTLRYCATRAGAHLEPSLVLALVDCAQLAEACAEPCMGDNSNAAPAAAACAKACERGARACAAFTEPEMSLAAEIMRYCAAACYRVVHAVPA